MKANSPKLATDAETVWAAAAAAYRMNGGYFKFIPSPDSPDPKPLTGSLNKTFVYNLLLNTDQITAEDREKGAEVRRYFQTLSFKLIQGRKLNEFERTCLELTGKEEIVTAFDRAVVSSLPGVYEKSVARDNVNRKIEWAKGGRVGTVGERIDIDVEIMKVIFSTNFNCYFITGMTMQDQVVRFSTSKRFEVGEKVSLRATVKSHNTDPVVTKLSRATRIEK